MKELTCLVKDGIIIKYNVVKPKIVIGKEEGIYLPIIDNIPSYNSNTQRISGKKYNVESDSVVIEYIIEDISEEELWGIKVKNVTELVQKTLDDKAKEKGYDNIISACSYAGFANTFQVEGQKFLVWRSSVWEMCYNILTQVQNNSIQEPTIEVLLDMLPKYEEVI